MQSFLFSGLVLLVVCGFGKAGPVNIDQLNHNNDSETRLIVPPEMTPNYFELLKVNSTKAEKAESTPMNFLRTSETTAINNGSIAHSLLAFDGNKQTPIFITIPIYITSGSEGIPIVAATIEQIPAPRKESKGISAGPVKNEDKNKQESSPSPNKQGQDKI